MSEPNHSGLSDNAAGAIAYFTFIPAVLLLFIPPYRSNRYVRFHAWQSLLLNLSAILISLMLSFVLVIFLVFEAELLLVFKRLVWVAWFVLWLICVVRALNGQRFRLPILGDIADRQASR
jgi:Predicted membrane protein